MAYDIFDVLEKRHAQDKSAFQGDTEATIAKQVAIVDERLVRELTIAPEVSSNGNAYYAACISTGEGLDSDFFWRFTATAYRRIGWEVNLLGAWHALFRWPVGARGVPDIQQKV